MLVYQDAHSIYMEAANGAKVLLKHPPVEDAAELDRIRREAESLLVKCVNIRLVENAD